MKSSERRPTTHLLLLVGDTGARLRAAVEANRDPFIAEGCGIADEGDCYRYENCGLQMPARIRTILQIHCLEGHIPEAFFNMSVASSDPEDDVLSNSL